MGGTGTPFGTLYHVLPFLPAPSCFLCPHGAWGHSHGQACTVTVTAGAGALTVCSNQGLDALPAPLAQPVDHEKQQGQDEEGGDAAHNEAHPAGHGVEQAIPIC